MGLRLRYAEQVQRTTIAEMISPTDNPDTPIPIEGFCPIGNMRFSDFPAEDLHEIARQRNSEVYELAKEYSQLVGSRWNGDSIVRHRMQKPALNEEVEKGSSHDLSRPYSELLGSAIGIQQLSKEHCRFSSKSHVVSFLIPTLNIYLSHHEQQKLSDFGKHQETAGNYNSWKNFVLSEQTAATKFFSKSLAAYVDFEAFRRHAYVVGGTGSGKSELLKLIAHHIITKLMKDDPKVSGVIIDPHGDMGTQIARFKECKGNDKVVLFDPLVNKQKTPSIDIFHAPDDSNETIEIMAENIVNAFDEIIADTNISAQMKTLLVPCVAVLLRRPNSSLGDLQRFMLDDGNEDLIELGKKSPSRGHAEFFRSGFSQKRFDPTKSSIYTRLQSLLNNSVFARMVNPQATFSLEDELNNGKFVVMNLPRGEIGGDVSSAFGRLVIAQIKNMGFRRAKQRENERAKTYVFIDECQNFVGESIKETLVELRKYGVYLILANQVLGQDMSPSLVNIILSNTDVKFMGKNALKTLTVMSKEVGANLEEMQRLTVGQFCGFVRQKQRHTRPFFFKTPSYLLGNAGSMSSQDWYAQKVAGWRGYVDNKRLDQIEYHDPRTSIDDVPKSSGVDLENAPRFKL